MTEPRTLHLPPGETKKQIRSHPFAMYPYQPYQPHSFNPAMFGGPSQWAPTMMPPPTTTTVRGDGQHHKRRRSPSSSSTSSSSSSSSIQGAPTSTARLEKAIERETSRRKRKKLLRKLHRARATLQRPVSAATDIAPAPRVAAAQTAVVPAAAIEALVSTAVSTAMAAAFEERRLIPPAPAGLPFTPTSSTKSPVSRGSVGALSPLPAQPPARGGSTQKRQPTFPGASSKRDSAGKPAGVSALINGTLRAIPAGTVASLRVGAIRKFMVNTKLLSIRGQRLVVYSGRREITFSNNTRHQLHFSYEAVDNAESASDESDSAMSSLSDASSSSSARGSTTSRLPDRVQDADIYADLRQWVPAAVVHKKPMMGPAGACGICVARILRWTNAWSLLDADVRAGAPEFESCPLDPKYDPRIPQRRDTAPPLYIGGSATLGPTSSARSAGISPHQEVVPHVTHETAVSLQKHNGVPVAMHSMTEMPRRLQGDRTLYWIVLSMDVQSQYQWVRWPDGEFRKKVAKATIWRYLSHVRAQHIAVRTGQQSDGPAHEWFRLSDISAHSAHPECPLPRKMDAIISLYVEDFKAISGETEARRVLSPSLSVSGLVEPPVGSAAAPRIVTPSSSSPVACAKPVSPPPPAAFTSTPPPLSSSSSSFALMAALAATAQRENRPLPCATFITVDDDASPAPIVPVDDVDPSPRGGERAVTLDHGSSAMDRAREFCSSISPPREGDGASDGAGGDNVLAEADEAPFDRAGDNVVPEDADEVVPERDADEAPSGAGDNVAPADADEAPSGGAGNNEVSVEADAAPVAGVGDNVVPAEADQAPPGDNVVSVEADPPGEGFGSGTPAALAPEMSPAPLGLHPDACRACATRSRGRSAWLKVGHSIWVCGACVMAARPLPTVSRKTCGACCVERKDRFALTAGTVWICSVCRASVSSI